ncbi:MAG: hypothetical protein ACKVQV_08690 [Bacteroidia bacterium]
MNVLPKGIIISFIASTAGILINCILFYSRRHIDIDPNHKLDVWFIGLITFFAFRHQFRVVFFDSVVSLEIERKLLRTAIVIITISAPIGTSIFAVFGIGEVFGVSLMSVYSLLFLWFGLIIKRGISGNVNFSVEEKRDYKIKIKGLILMDSLSLLFWIMYFLRIFGIMDNGG